MRTRLVTVTLVTVCLATLALTASVADPSSLDEEGLDNLPSNRTSEDYDENGELITTTTRDDGTVVTGTDVKSDPNFEANTEDETVSISGITKVRDSKSKRFPEDGDAEDCGEPPSKENLRIERGRKSRYSVGDVVYYSCEYGYVTDGFERTAQCYLSETTDSLQWRQPNIICNPRSCGDPGDVPNGQRIGSVFTFPNRVSFECDEGFELKGNAHRYCTTTGTWSGQLPTCEKIMCEPPLSPINGKVSFDSLEFGTELRYMCNEGFLLRNDQTRICSVNGTWSGDDPICQEAQCEPPVAPDYGTVQVVGGKSSVGSMAIYTCEGDRFLVGSASSKCLDIGQWTFPTPKCLESCSVPKVPHGKIGKYVRKYGRKTFKNMEEGDKIEDGSDLYLTCEKNYEPFGTTNLEEKIICSQGEWSRYPLCEPAACRLPPPRTPNSDRFNTDYKHGSGVIYYCNKDSRKTDTGNVKCHFGTWNGKTPKCKDTRCDVDSLAFAGVKKEAGKRFYNHFQTYTPVCAEGYIASKADNKLLCRDSEWKGHFPPCEPANCSSDPPTIANGEVVPNFSRFHTSEVNYECDEPYLLKSSASKVQCSFGKWTGTPPKCQDVRCYTDHLKKNLGVSIDTASITDNGGSLQVICDEGFTSTGIQPKCVDGEWREPQPPCRENGCNIYNINKGKITEKVNKKDCNIFGRNCEYWQEFIEVGRNRKFNAGSNLYITCDKGHTLHGKGENNVPIKCSRGQWNPRLVCWRTGMPYHEEAEEVLKAKSRVGTSKQAVRTSTTKPVADTVQLPLAPRNSQSPVVSTVQSPPTDPSVAEDQFRVSGRNCSCTYYNLDPNLAGYAGTERLQSGTGIKDGCKVRFHCSPLGYFRMMGAREIICKECRTWHSAEYPQCALPQVGDSVVRITSHPVHTEMPGGTLGINEGSTLLLTCIANGPDIRPTWTAIPRSDNVFIYDQDIFESGYYIKTQVVKINSIRPWHSGKYECTVWGYRPYYLEVQVISPDVSCPIFSEKEDFTVHYDRGQSFNSSAVFSCKNPSDRVVGSVILTCMMNGQWSGDPPQCIKTCPELPVTESGLQVIYSNGQDIDSTASFHCLLPGVRKGVPFTRCKKSGKWADPIPTCEVPSCPVESLYREIPENVVPILDESVGESVAYNSSLQLMCVDNRRIVGEDAIAKCGTQGKWQVAKVRCVAGCPPVDKSLDMLLDPEEEFYNVGQFVTFSCAPGQVLSSEVVRMMCLRGVIGPEWSEKDIPRCVNKPTEAEGKTHSGKKRVEPVDDDSEESDESMNP